MRTTRMTSLPVTSSWISWGSRGLPSHAHVVAVAPVATVVHGAVLAHEAPVRGAVASVARSVGAAVAEGRVEQADDVDGIAAVDMTSASLAPTGQGRGQRRATRNLRHGIGNFEQLTANRRAGLTRRQLLCK